jgi:predicted nucleic acid-binding protein
VLDANILGKVCHPRPPANRPIAEWLRYSLKAADLYVVVIPEIVDYEYRRLLICRAVYQGNTEAQASLQRLDALRASSCFLPIVSGAMTIAGDLWARTRAQGRPIDDDKGLGADVILAAQAIHGCENPQIVTENKKHLARFVPVFPLEQHLEASNP